ncbi:uncharacterized protein LOC114397062 [Glycine soja]|uniref:uncharacterized protein LOC114397062 n=1 Tax=Glycine soja TaxID=3848 RepID=UPI0010405755|nr:uncharacterized protein LOC114397062 [Glycine soja]
MWFWLARLNFPRFNGKGVKNWIIRCDTFFSVDQTPEEYKVRLAVVHFEGKALQWHSAYVKNVGLNKLPSWTDYTKILIERFGEVCEDPMAELMRLRQKGTVTDYHTEFDAIVSRIDLSEANQLSCFLGGLQMEIQMMVRMFQPTSVMKAFSLAKMYENANAISMQAKPLSKTLKPNPVTKPPLLPNPPKTLEPIKPTTQTTKQLTPAYMSERRAKGLCYFCDEPFTPVHSQTHKKLQIHAMEIAENADSDEDLGPTENPPHETNPKPLISVNALTGVAKFQTLRVTGQVRKKPLHILIDSESTHNFLDIHVAKKLGCKIEDMDHVSVTVAHGARVQINTMVKGFSWLVQNTTFSSDILLLPLGYCDMILGIKWLITLGNITWNFDKLTMEFTAQGKRHVLRGNSSINIKIIRKQWIHKTLAAGVHISMLQVCESEEGLLLHSLSTHATSSSILDSIDKLLLQYEDVFAVPTTLSPRRSDHDHTIPLVQGTNLNNSSPYSSFVVLVGKKDGSWRLCIDYRDLNKGTVKDGFPIPLVDDLLDELHGSTVFSKIDLRSGYNQVRMAEADGLMNFVFQEYLRRFLLVFFDDILIYSKSMKDHLHHLQTFLSTMRANALLAKKSKCYFGVTLVEYLGHFITGEGVSTSPTKVEAVRNWPLPQTPKQLKGFLGLVGYYRRFVRRYSTIAKPLNDMLKKDSFSWFEEAKLAFQCLKDQLSRTPVLALPDFTKTFIVEVDASGAGVGAVLMQDHHPIAFISRSLNVQQHSLSTYEKELLAVVFAGSENQAADALSRVE